MQHRLGDAFFWLSSSMLKTAYCVLYRPPQGGTLMTALKIGRLCQWHDDMMTKQLQLPCNFWHEMKLCCCSCPAQLASWWSVCLTSFHGHICSKFSTNCGVMTRIWHKSSASLKIGKCASEVEASTLNCWQICMWGWSRQFRPATATATTWDCGGIGKRLRISAESCKSLPFLQLALNFSRCWPATTSNVINFNKLLPNSTASDGQTVFGALEAEPSSDLKKERY